MSKKKWTKEQIEKIVQQTTALGLRYKQAAQQFGIPVWKIYQFNHVRNKNNEDGADFPIPQDDIQNHSIPNNLNTNKEALQHVSLIHPIHPENPDKSQLPEQVKEIIVQYREQNPYYGFKRIEQYLRNTHLLVIPRKQIRQVLKEKGLLEGHDSSFDNLQAANELPETRRFEASKPFELFQMDITYVYIEGLKVLYLVDIIDDHSRFCLSASLRFDQSSDTLIEILHHVILTFGKPEKLLTDQGTAFYSWSCEKTKFQNYLDDMRIEHIVADPHHPTTNGKVERFHQTIKNELIRKVKFKSYTDAVEKIEAFIHHYNYQRPHQSLDGSCPADRFMGISVSKALARHELLSKDLQPTKGYLVYKLGPYEVSIINRTDQPPSVFVNGVCYIKKNDQML